MNFGSHPGDWGHIDFAFNPNFIPENATSVTFYIKAAVGTDIMDHLSVRFAENKRKDDPVVWHDSSYIVKTIAVIDGTENEWIKVTISGSMFKALIDPQAGSISGAASPSAQV